MAFYPGLQNVNPTVTITLSFMKRDHKKSLNQLHWMVILNYLSDLELKENAHHKIINRKKKTCFIIHF